MPCPVAGVVSRREARERLMTRGNAGTHGWPDRRWGGRSVAGNGRRGWADLRRPAAGAGQGRGLPTGAPLDGPRRRADGCGRRRSRLRRGPLEVPSASQAAPVVTRPQPTQPGRQVNSTVCSRTCRPDTTDRPCGSPLAWPFHVMGYAADARRMIGVSAWVRESLRSWRHLQSSSLTTVTCSPSAATRWVCPEDRRWHDRSAAPPRGSLRRAGP